MMESKKRKKFLAATFTLTGTIIGAGILGLPYVFAQAGFFAGLFWTIFIGAILIYVNLGLGEVTLRTKVVHQLPGYAKKYIGKTGERLMLFAVVFGIYSALLAYLIGEGESFSTLFFGHTGYAIYFGIAFWFLMTSLLQGGLRRLKQIEYWGVFFVIGFILIIFIALLPSISYENLRPVNYSLFFLPFGVILFALLGFTSIPEVRREIAGDEKFFKKVILFGILIPIVLYIMFSFAFVGTLGTSVKDVATISFSGELGKVMILLGVFTMLTSYFVLGFALKDIFTFDLRKNKFSFFFVFLLPLIFYLIVSFFNLAGFVLVLGIGGVISGGLTGILIMIMNINAKKTGDRKPEYSIKINKILAIVISLIFVAGVVLELFF